MKLFRLACDLRDRVFGLDLLRAIAILIVVLGHGDAIIRANFPNRIDFWVIDGVDLFFVLSGFLIGSILIKSFAKKGIDFRSNLIFWKRRWFRTLPNYYLAVALCLIYTLIKTGSLGDYSTDYLLFAQNIKNPHPDFLGVAWSLAVEEWFYILFPSAVLVIYRIFPRLQIKYIVLIAIGLFFAMPLLYRIVREARLVSASVPTDYWDALFRKTVASRLDTIAFGILGAYVAYYHPRAWDSLKYLKFVLGLAIIGVAKFCMGGGIWFFTAYFDVLGLGILLLMPLLASIKTAPRCIAMPVTYISMASYSMYLIHSSLILDPILTYGEPFSKSSAAVCYVGYLTIAILASIAIYKYFEKPMMDLREKTYTL